MRKLFNNTYMKAGLAILAFGLVIALPTLGFAAVLGGGAISYAANIAGPLSVDKIDTADPNHLLDSVSKFVTKQKPADYFLDTVIRSIGNKEQAIHPEHKYDEVVYRGWSTTSSSAFNAVGGAADEQAVIPVTDASLFTEGQTVRLGGILNGSSQEIRGLVLAKTSSSITVAALNGDTGLRVPDVANGTTIYRQSTAKNELSAQHDVITVNPTQDENYCQLRQCQIERSVMSARTKSKSGYNYNDRKMEVIWQFRSENEADDLFGVKKKATRPDNSEIVYSAEGIIPKISQTINFGTGSGAVDPSLNDIVDIMTQVFAPNSGSEVRYLFGGKNFIAGLSKIDKYDRNLQNVGSEIVHGVNVTALESPFGKVYVKHSKTLDQQGWADNGLILDFDHIVKAELEPMIATPLNLNNTGVRRVQDAVRIDENYCLTPRYTGAGGVHAILKPTA